MLERFRQLITQEVPTPNQVVFTDFETSEKPDEQAPECRACGEELYWSPDRYAFGSNGYFFVVPKIGRWKCPDGHPGKIHHPDLQQFADRIQRFLAEGIPFQ